MRPSQAFHTLETLRNLSSVPLRRKGVELSLNDNQTVLDVYQQWLLLELDLGYLHPESLERDAQRQWIDLIHADVYDLNSAFAECLHLVRMQTNKGFKGLCSRISTHLYPLIKSDIVEMSHGDVLAARRLVQLFSYTGRLSLQDIDLTQQQLEDYLGIEESISDSYPQGIVSTLNRIVQRWIGPELPSEIVPQHGPGGIANVGRCSYQDKYELLATDRRLEYVLGDPWWLVEPDRSKLDRTSQTIFVPKSYKSFRTISMEPATLQYFQQGVWKVIDRLVLRNGYLRNRIGFQDQSRNRELARIGSISRVYATIDLSAASDSVSYALIKKVFYGTWVWRYLIALRSDNTILPDGRKVKLKKYAPMGSSLCFPIETILFASICEHVTRVHHVAGHYSVYGDDIIVPTQCAETVMRMLAVLGFRVNHDKSFYQSTCWFRESCGGEYCDGFDVTPMRVSRSYASREQFVRLGKLIDKANEAYTHGFRNLRYFYLQKLRAEGYVPLFSPTTLLSDNYTNYHTKKRWNRKLQRIEVKVTTLFTKYSPKELSSQDEQIRYRHWLESCYERTALGDGFESIVCRPMVLAKDSWGMKPYELLDQEFIDQSLGRG